MQTTTKNAYINIKNFGVDVITLYINNYLELNPGGDLHMHVYVQSK